MQECQFRVSVPKGNGYSDPRGMVRITDHFQHLKLAAEFKCENGVPVKEADDTYTMITKDECATSLAPRILKSHYGLIVNPI